MLASQINTRPKLYRGELFDITITSYNNKFGNEKIKTSFEYGINFPIIYYINELEKIIDKDPSDDKIEKRRKRLEFLKICNTPQNKIVIDLFNNLIIYLNGGSMNISNNYNNQPLIVVLAGGNIISIFFNLLKLLLSEESGVDIIFNLFDNEKTSEEFQKLLEQIKYSLKDNSYLRDYLESSEYQNYSDLDLNLLPNRLDNEWFIYNGGVGKRRLTEAEILMETSFKEPIKSRKEIMEEKRKLKEYEEKLNKEEEKKNLQVLAKKKKLREAEKKLREAEKKKIKEEEKKKRAEILAANKKSLKEAEKKEKRIKEKNEDFRKYTQDEYLSGFILCRIKSSFPCLDNIVKNFTDNNKQFLNIDDEIDILNSTIQNKPENCDFNDLNKLNITYDKLIAHLSKKNWLSSDVSPQCLAFIKKLLSKKLFTKKCTDANTLVISRSNFDFDPNNSNFIYYDSKDEINKLKNIIYYIHLITFNINNSILNNNPLYDNYDKTATNLFDNFFDLHSIIKSNDGILLKIIKQIIDNFYYLKDTKTIIKNIQNIYSACGEEKETSYQLYSTPDPNIRKYKNFVEATLKLNDSIRTYDKGTFITINILKSFKEDELILHNIDESSFFDVEIDYILNDNLKPLTDDEKRKIEEEIDDIIKEKEDEEKEKEDEEKEKEDEEKEKEDLKKRLESIEELGDAMDIAKGLKKKFKKKYILSKIKSKVSKKIKEYKKKKKSKKTQKRFKRFVKKVMRLTKKCKKKKYKNTKKCKKFLHIVK